MSKNLKGLLKSKVFWWNAITSVMEVAGLLTGIVPPGTSLVINAVGNIALRFLTTKPLGEK